MGGLTIAVLCLAAALLIALSQPPTGIGPARSTEELRNPRAVDAAELNERLGRGVNILGYDPIWSSGRPRFDDRHFRLIKDAGFDHVRINLRPFRDADPDLSGRLPETWLQTVDWAVEQALANRLLVVLDLHEFEVMGADPAGNRERFLSVWEQMAARYRSAPAEVLFEILNEPNQKLTPVLWNDYLRDALAAIRTTNPTRTVIIGPARSNSIKGLDELELPVGDRRIIVTIHYYQPFRFTHQGARWVGLQDEVGVRWAGTEQQRQAVRRDFDLAERWAREHDRRLYLGEFGAYEAADMDSRALWTGFVAREAERRGWSWSYWQFDSDFIVYDIPAEKWVEPIRMALLPG